MFTAELPDVSVFGHQPANRFRIRVGPAHSGARCRRAHHHVQYDDDPIFAARAIEIGAKGYVSKAGDPCDLVEAIQEVGNGGVYLPAAIARSVAFAGPAVAQNPLSKLTSREIEILRLLSAGKSLFRDRVAGAFIL